MKPSPDVSTTEEYTSLADSLPEKWRQEFLLFVTSGVASERFLEFLDSDAAAQQAVESAVAHEISNFNRFAESLDVDQELIDNYLKRKGRKPLDVARAAISRIMSALLEIRPLASRDRSEAISAILATLPAAQAEEVGRMLDAVRSDVHATVTSRSTLDGPEFEMKPTR